MNAIEWLEEAAKIAESDEELVHGHAPTWGDYVPTAAGRRIAERIRAYAASVKPQYVFHHSTAEPDEKGSQLLDMRVVEDLSKAIEQTKAASVEPGAALAKLYPESARWYSIVCEELLALIPTLTAGSDQQKWAMAELRCAEKMLAGATASPKCVHDRAKNTCWICRPMVEGAAASPESELPPITVGKGTDREDVHPAWRAWRSGQPKSVLLRCGETENELTRAYDAIVKAQAEPAAASVEGGAASFWPVWCKRNNFAVDGAGSSVAQLFAEAYLAQSTQEISNDCKGWQAEKENEYKQSDPAKAERVAEPTPEEPKEIPSLWKFYPCPHEDYEQGCSRCEEEILTGKTEKAYRAGYRAALAAFRGGKG